MIPCSTSETTTVRSAEVFVSLAVHRHADAVGESRQRNDDLGVVAVHSVVGHHRRLDPVLGELPEKLERDVRDDLDVHPGVVVDLHAGDRVHVRDVPPSLQLLVLVHALDHRAQGPVRPHGHPDAHLGDGLRRCEPNLTLGLGRHGLVDSLLGLRVEHRPGSLRRLARALAGRAPGGEESQPIRLDAPWPISLAIAE
jgi:hypothetical protein